MILSYPAKIKYFKADKSYLVEFPDLPGCITEGRNLNEARIFAREALTGYLASIFDREHKIPAPSGIKGRHINAWKNPERAILLSRPSKDWPGFLIKT